MVCHRVWFQTAIDILFHLFGRPCCRFYSVRSRLVRRTTLRWMVRVSVSIEPWNRSYLALCHHVRMIGIFGYLTVSLLSTVLGHRLQDRVLSLSYLVMSRRCRYSLLLVSLVVALYSRFWIVYVRCNRCLLQCVTH